MHENELICRIKPFRHIIFIMGVAGCGKTTIGNLLSKQTGIPFFDADDYHSPANIEKMKACIPLTDADRKGWLQTINKLAVKQQQEKGAIIACSALKQSYRDNLQENITSPRWFFLEGSPGLILDRLEKRKGHFMPPGLLQSQFDSLEPPAGACTININNDPGQIISIITDELNRGADQVN